MIDSSLIAGSQPTGVTSLLGIAGPSQLIAGKGAANMVGAAAGPDGRIGDGFRERFEVSMGLVRSNGVEADGETPGSGGGGVGSGGLQLAVAANGSRVALGTSSSGPASQHQIAKGAVAVAAETTRTGNEATAINTTYDAGVAGDEDGMAGLATSLESQSNFWIEDHVQQAVASDSGPASKMMGEAVRLSASSKSTQADALQAVSQPSAAANTSVIDTKTLGSKTATNGRQASMSVVDGSSEVTGAVAGWDRSPGTRVTVKRSNSGVAGTEISAPSPTAPMKSQSTGELPVVGQEAAQKNVFAGPVSLDTSEESLQVSDKPLQTTAGTAKVPGSTSTNTTLVARRSVAASVQPEVGQSSTLGTFDVKKMASDSDQGEGGLATQKSKKADASIAGAATSAIVVGLPIQPPAIPPVAVDSPIAPLPEGRGLAVNDTNAAVGKNESVSAAGGPFASIGAPRGVGTSSLGKEASGGFEAPATFQPGDAVNVTDPRQSKSQDSGLRFADRFLAAQREAVSSDPGSEAEGAAIANETDVVGGLQADLPSAASDITTITPAVQPALSFAPDAVLTLPERKGAAAKAVGPVRESSSPLAATDASVSATTQGVQAETTAVVPTTAKVGGEPLAGAKGMGLHGEPGTAQNSSVILAASPVHHEALGETKSDAGLQEQTVSARLSELSGIASGGERLAHTTLVATPTVLEVGVASGTNGWLKVRAEMDGTGGVAASMVTTTASAAEALHKELPSLSAYLRDESVGVSSLVVNRAEGGTIAHDSTASFGAGSQSGRGGQPSSGEVPVHREPTPDGIEPAVRGVRSDSLGGATPVAGYGAASGGWLNVVA